MRAFAAFWKHRREMERCRGGRRLRFSRKPTPTRADELGLLEYMLCNENKNVTTEANSVPASPKGVLVTGKAFKLVDAGAIPAVDGGDQGGVEAISKAVVVERSVLEAVEGEIHSSDPPPRRNS